MQYPIQSDIHARLRLDKWLWAARFFKTRSLATDAVNKGRATLNGTAVKPARDVRVGDQVRIELDGLAWEIEVLGICEVRGPAGIAQTLYRETPQSVAQRDAELARRKLFREPAAALHGRPTKRDRREIGRLNPKISGRSPRED
jgi:ribosome-associated heat shock protein Hsp15